MSNFFIFLFTTKSFSAVTTSFYKISKLVCCFKRKRQLWLDWAKTQQKFPDAVNINYKIFCAWLFTFSLYLKFYFKAAKQYALSTTRNPSQFSHISSLHTIPKVVVVSTLFLVQATSNSELRFRMSSNLGKLRLLWFHSLSQSIGIYYYEMWATWLTREIALAAIEKNTLSRLELKKRTNKKLYREIETISEAFLVAPKKTLTALLSLTLLSDICSVLLPPLQPPPFSTTNCCWWKSSVEWSLHCTNLTSKSQREWQLHTATTDTNQLYENQKWKKHTWNLEGFF